MYGFGEDLTKENILKKISSYDIFRHYCEPFSKVGKGFCSELRVDNKASCSIDVSKGDLKYIDFTTGETYRCFDYVMKKYDIDFHTALNKVNEDFNLKLGIYGLKSDNLVKKSPIITNKKFIEKEYTILKKRQRPFTKKDLEYWNSFYWTEWMLNEAKTQSISNYWVNENMFYVKPDELAFSYEYYYHGGRVQRKLYFPERKEYKWFSNVDNSIVQLVDVAPKTGDILFITSSKKDAGIFWRIMLEGMSNNLVIHGIAPNNEAAFPIEAWFEKAKKRWKRIVLYYNNDEAGIRNSIKYSEKYGIEWFVNPEGEPKDPSDFAKKYNLEEFKNLIFSKL